MIELATALVLAKEAYGYIKDGKEYFGVIKGAWDGIMGVKEHFEVNEGEPKLVGGDWLEKSGFAAKSKDDGYELRWSKPDKVASREIDGYEVMFEINKSKRTRHKLVLYDGLTLIGRKVPV